MAFDNKYPNRKDWRKPYRDSRAFDRYCRTEYGICDYCSNNRQFANRRRAPVEDKYETSIGTIII